MAVILGINTYHANSSAALVVDGRLVAAVEEERFTRAKYETGFPHHSIDYCLRAGGIEARDVGHIAVSRNPLAHLGSKAWFAASTRAGREMIRARGDLLQFFRVKRTMAEGLGVDVRALRAKLHLVEHHRAHIASAFFVSPFERAAVLSLDGSGDMVSAMWGTGEGSRLRIAGRVLYPHSLGVFYQAMTQYLGFSKWGDEYKVMGLASYGRPTYESGMRAVLRNDGMQFRLNLDCFRHHRHNIPMTWDGGPASISRLWGGELEHRFGPARRDGDPVEQRHKDVAASMQHRLEEVELDMLRTLQLATDMQSLAMAGGVALNCVANGRIRHETDFRHVYVQPAAYDGGTSVGAAFYVYHHVLGHPRGYVMDHTYLGPAFDERTCAQALGAAGLQLRRLGDDELLEWASSSLDRGKILGWFQGRMEFGPRALGNRSILADPRREEIRDALNARIKHREPFRPFAPAVLEESLTDWFEDDAPSPFMLMTYRVRPDRRELVPAPIHVDGTGRVQTVRRDQNPRFHDLIARFGRRTGIPLLLNTSFNENEPICCTPREAVETFRRTRMDAMALGNLVVERHG